MFKEKCFNLKQVSVLLCVLLAIAVTVLCQRTGAAGSDPRGTLLVSQEIIRSGTIKLDNVSSGLLSTFAHQVVTKNGHKYNYFPLGTALFSVPFVALANAVGVDMEQHEAYMQLIIAAVICVLIGMALYSTARMYVSPLLSISLVAIFWFGSSLVSTVGTALWSHDLAVLCSSVAIYLVLRIRSGKDKGSLAVALGLLLFMGYISRPTSAIFVFCLLAWCLFENRRMAITAGMVLAACLCGFVFWSQHEYGQWLPDYYLPKRLEGTEFEKAAIANLVSPARGLFVYSPYLFLSLVFSGLMLHKQVFMPMLLVTLAWPVMHWWAISHFPHWWGGWSYGARLMVDVLPGLFLAIFEGLKTFPQIRIQSIMIILLSGLFSVYVNTVQGTFNPHAYLLWNKEPNIDLNPQFIFDWRYPQFLHNDSRHIARLKEFRYAELGPFSSKLDLLPSDKNALFHGFSSPESGFIWTNSTNASLVFVSKSTDFEGEARMQVALLDVQRLAVVFNGKLVYHDKLDGGKHDIRFSIAPELFRIGENKLEFSLPDAHFPSNGDPRILAMQLFSVSLR